MSAAQAAEAMRTGWQRAAAEHGVPLDIDVQPLSDGGPGFASVLSGALAADAGRHVEVPGPTGRLLRMDVPLVRRRDGSVEAVLESAACIGLDLLAPAERNPEATSTAGLGVALGTMVDAGLRRVVVGLGGSGTVDGGAGLLGALGARAWDGSGREVDLRAGGAVLVDVRTLDLTGARARVGEVEIVVGCDVDVPLTGPSGAARGFAPQKGADAAAVERLAQALESWGRAGDAVGGDRDRVSERPGAGAAGGLGFALALLGAELRAGAELVAEAVDLPGRIARADLVVTGEGCLDWQSRRGKVAAAVAGLALRTATPVLVLAGRIELGRREMAAMGIAAAHGLVETPSAHTGSPADLADLAARTATRFLPARNIAPPGA